MKSDHEGNRKGDIIELKHLVRLKVGATSKWRQLQVVPVPLDLPITGHIMKSKFDKK